MRIQSINCFGRCIRGSLFLLATDSNHAVLTPVKSVTRTSPSSMSSTADIIIILLFRSSSTHSRESKGANRKSALEHTVHTSPFSVRCNNMCKVDSVATTAKEDSLTLRPTKACTPCRPTLRQHRYKYECPEIDSGLPQAVFHECSRLCASGPIRLPP
jgi:hypothetical protein